MATCLAFRSKGKSLDVPPADEDSSLHSKRIGSNTYTTHAVAPRRYTTLGNSFYAVHIPKDGCTIKTLGPHFLRYWDWSARKDINTADGDVKRFQVYSVNYGCLIHLLYLTSPGYNCDRDDALCRHSCRFGTPFFWATLCPKSQSSEPLNYSIK